MEGRLPPGQKVATRLPVLHHGAVPDIRLQDWMLRCFGLVQREVLLSYEEFARLPMAERALDVHCVTGWSVLGARWEGVPAPELLRLVPRKPEARFVMVHAEGGWTTNLDIHDLDRDDVLFAVRYNGSELLPEHGWPVRLVVPHLYFWKSAKWVAGLEFMQHNRPGFWESAGYHMRGDPWKEERYSKYE